MEKMRTTTLLRRKFILFPICVFAILPILHFTTSGFGSGSGYRDARDDFKAFITSSYYYPKSKNLGDNTLAIVMSVNQKAWIKSDLYDSSATPDFYVKAKNSTDTVLVKTTYTKITPHPVCHMIAVIAMVTVLPNTKSISLVSGNGSVMIPFETPPDVKRDVVVCISPLFLNEQWQNFLFAVHIYKKFGAFMNLYMISAVDSIYHLMKEYEQQDYLTIQPWVSAKFVGVKLSVADPYMDTEFRNQAGSQTDCLLKYKDTAKYVTFLDLDDVLIPRLAPTYLEEFNLLTQNRNVFLHYAKENHIVSAVRYGDKFSFADMFRSIKYTRKQETGKMVLNPKTLNYTWIHWPPYIPGGVEKIVVSDNTITHLKSIKWVDELPKGNLPKYHNYASFDIIDSQSIEEIEQDWMKMKNRSKVLRALPTDTFYSRIISTCYYEKFYRFNDQNITDCPGPQMCLYPQNENIKCMRVDANYHRVPNMSPISFHYATDPRFSSEKGCYPH